ncbi:hypothetical protein HGA08_18220 [Nocardia vermiculata]|uniref:Mce-associated membrane protein n=1 Tax=Nocardia vermiculata TaxID=257274 RepID=A0A846XY92_9NOCA|nr:hypothetical protein [Nocardia vermiculata]
MFSRSGNIILIDCPARSDERSDAVTSGHEQTRADPVGDDLLLAAEEAEAEAVAAEATAAAARARARATQLRRRAGNPVSTASSPEPPATTSDRSTSAPTVPEPSASDDADTTAVASNADTAIPDASTPEPADASPRSEPPPAPSGSVAANRDTPRAAKARRLRRALRPPRVSIPRPRRVSVTRPGRRTIATTVAVLVLCAGVGSTGYFVWHHHTVTGEQQRKAEFVAAARQGVTSLTSLDFTHAAADVKRVLDDSTGSFRSDFQTRADDFTKVIEQSKVATEGKVNSAAVQSMTDDSAVVLVAASSKVTNSAGAQQEPRAWRLSVTVERVDGLLKMSKVEFVP